MALLAALAAAVLAPGPGAPGPDPARSAAPAAQHATARQADDAPLLAGTVRNPAMPRDARNAAADALVARADEPAARRELERLLLSNSGAQALALEAVGRSPTAPSELLPVLERLAERAGPASAPAVFRAIASLRSREAAAVLLRYADVRHPAETRGAAFDGLARLSGRADLGQSFGAWRDWFTAVPEARWRGEILAGVARRADALASEVRAASGRINDALRRLYLATPPEERSGLLTVMLLDESPDTRTLAFELASRELSSSRRLDAEVGEVAMGLLTHADPGVRANAAALVNRLNPPQAEARVLAALERETDPQAASAMILAAARRPSAPGIDAVFRWLEKRGAAFGAAADATWSLLRSGQLSRPEYAARVLRALRGTPDDQLTPACCAILGAIGGEEGRERLTRLLETAAAAIRASAAQALALDPESLDAILRAAAEEPQVFGGAAQSVMMHRPTAAAFRAAAALPAPTPDVQRRALLSIAGQLPATDLLEIAREAGDDMALRESYLTLLASPNRILAESADPDNLGAIAEGVILLARTRLELDRPDAAAAALDALPGLTDLVDHLRVSRLRATAMLCLNRVEEAAALGAPPGVWIDALERSVNKPFARSLADQIRERFGDQLDEGESERLDRIAELLPPAVPGPEDPEFVGPRLPAAEAPRAE